MHQPAVIQNGAGSSNPEVIIPQELQVKAVGRQESKLAGEAPSEQKESRR